MVERGCNPSAQAVQVWDPVELGSPCLKARMEERNVKAGNADIQELARTLCFLKSAEGYSFWLLAFEPNKTHPDL